MTCVSFLEISRLLKTVDVYKKTKLNLPEYCYHLGNGMFVIICLNENLTNIHLCEFVKNAADDLVPSENEITLTPFIWQAFCDSLNNPEFVDLPCFFESISLVKNELFLSIVEKNNRMCICMQKCLIKHDYSRAFIPGVLLLSEYQWSVLKDINHIISDAAVSFMFKHELKLWSLIETETYFGVLSNDNVQKEEAEMTLTLSLAKLLKIHLEKAIDSVFKSKACLLKWDSQLGHECITFNEEEKLNKYFYLAISTFNLKEIACEFVYDNESLLRFITNGFFVTLNIKCLLDFIRKLY